MPRPRPKKKPTRQQLTAEELEQRREAAHVRRLMAGVKRLRAAVRTIDREHQRFEADLEHLAMGVLNDRGFVIVGKKEHNELIDENMNLRLDLARMEQQIVEGPRAADVVPR